MHRLLALVCVLVVVCETGCCGARRRYSNCVPDACGSCGEVACSPGCGCGSRGGRIKGRRAPLFGRGSGGGFWSGFGDDCCDTGCDGGCGVPMEGMPYSGGGCSCGQGHVMEGQSFSTTTNMAPGAPAAIQQQQVYSPAAVPPAPPMEPVPVPAAPQPGKVETMSGEYFHPQATLVPPGASPTSLQAPQVMHIPEIPAAVQQAPPVLQMPAQGTIVPASSVMSTPAPVQMTAPTAMPPAQPAAAQPLLWVPSGVQQ